ncbi:MAG: hypothetical protein M3N93_15125, partial [Acidobacteriota bacterium]|nr:hypothetical protein [Acidobacteriota bacterium]
MTKHRCSNLLALLALIAIVLGACLTSETRPLPGAVAASAAAASEPQLEQAHRIAGYVTAAGTAGLAIWVTNLPGWLALAIM